MNIRYYQGLPEYETLKEIPLPDNGIDKKVADLVRALQSIRVGTLASCEGHLDEDHHWHPWINSNPFSYAKLEALHYLVELYNNDNKIKWELSGGSLSPLTYREMCHSCNEGYLENMPQEMLRQLQRSADELAIHIFNNRQDERIRELILVYGF